MAAIPTTPTPATIPTNNSAAALPAPCLTCLEDEKDKHKGDPGERSEWIDKDGNRHVTVRYKDGTYQSTTYNKDGSIDRFELSNGLRTVTKQDKAGNISRVVTVEDKTGRMVSQDKWNTDGSQFHGRDYEDGWFVGGSKETTVRPDGSYITTEKSRAGIGIVGGTMETTQMYDATGKQVYNTTAMSQHIGIPYVAELNVNESGGTPGASTWGLGAGAKVLNGYGADVHAGASVQMMDGGLVGGGADAGASVAKGWVGRLQGSGASTIDPLTSSRSTSFGADVAVVDNIGLGGSYNGGTIRNMTGQEIGSFNAGEARGSLGPLSTTFYGGQQTVSGVSTYSGGNSWLGAVTYTDGGAGKGFGGTWDATGGIGKIPGQ